jgi:hypothetical protein
VDGGSLIVRIDLNVLIEGLGMGRSGQRAVPLVAAHVGMYSDVAYLVELGSQPYCLNSKSSGC